MLQGTFGRRAAAAAVGLLALLAPAACGGSDASTATEGRGDTGASAGIKAGGDATTTSSSAGGAGGSTTTVGAAATTVAARQWASVGKTGWYDGFRITLVDVEAQPSGNGAKVVVNATYENLTQTSENTPRGEILSMGKVVYGSWESPKVPGGGKASGSIAVNIELGKTSLDKAAFDKLLANLAIQYGDADSNQTIIPFDPAQSVTSVEPRTLALTGRLQQGALVVEIVSGGLRPSYKSGDKGKAELSMRIKVSCAAECTRYGVSMNRDMLSLATPKGTSAVPDVRSTYCCDAVYPGTVSDNARNVVTFLVPNPGTGAYTLTLKSDSLAAEGAAPATFAFTV